ncbi:MAG TPA: hypothetical protein DHV49_01030 [Alphaproteobacteria bacterium]|nr:hypothetical protein [Alphaproteobacteria bacterium]|tara:strand:+ start:96 stop:737 length:642 start_codon:yes stop_codon:yes gene_type:complete
MGENNMFNYVALTAATCPFSNRQAALETMHAFAQDCREHGAGRVLFGNVISGRYPDHLLFIQQFERLENFQNVVEMIPSNKNYGKMANELGVAVTGRNIMQVKDVPFDPVLEPKPEYLALTFAHLKNQDEQTFLGHMRDSATVFKSNGAQTLRMARIFSGDPVGAYVLGVTYPNMEAIDKTYLGLAGHAPFQTMAQGIDVQMRSITKIAGLLA